MRKKMIIIAAASVFALLAVIAAVLVMSEYGKRNTYMSFYEYFSDFDENRLNIALEGELVFLENPPVVSDGVLYLPVGFIKTYIDNYIFWEPDSGRLTVTGGSFVYKFNAGEKEYTYNMYTELELDAPIISMDGEAYMPEGLLKELYEAEIFWRGDNENNVIVVERPDYSDGFVRTRAVTEKGGVLLRYEPDKYAPICVKLAEGAALTVVPDADSDGGEYSKVYTESGFIGYVLSADIKVSETVSYVRSAGEEYTTPVVAENGKILMTWNYFGTVAQSSNKSNQVMGRGQDVVSPTWFSFDADKLDGSIVMLGNKEYSRWAHSQGLQVWGLITDNFSYDVSNAVLTVTEHREYAVRQLVNFVDFFEMDGINIDFEMVRAEDIKYFIQFLRELYPLLRENGKILSVDMYTPQNWNMYWNRTEVAKTCDYVIVMGYDEHWSTSPVAGPNASIAFVRNAVVNTLKEVPPEKLILGIPFFVRVWKETPDSSGNITVSSRTYSMNAAYDLFVQNGAEFKWYESTANYYAEYYVKEDGVNVKYSVWLEDERSMEEKLKIAVEHDIAGVSAWRKGLEKDTIWDLLNDYMKN